MKINLYQLYQIMLETMGPTGWWPADSKQQIIIEAILIQNTTEANATKASQAIKESCHYDFKILVTMNPETLAKLVRPAGFMTNKTKAIQTVAQWFLNHHEDWIAIQENYREDLRKVLLGLFGIGPETADVLLTYVFDQPQFIADKYARTLFAHLGLPEWTDYKALNKDLNLLPTPFTSDDAKEFHGLIDEFGKVYFGRHVLFHESFLANYKLIDFR